MGDGWGVPAYDENDEQDDVNPAVSDYDDFMAREGDLWEGKSFADALALEASWEEEDEEPMEGVEFGLDDGEYDDDYDPEDGEDNPDDW